MSEVFNIYCDESCHLEHDRIPIMLIGGIWCPFRSVKKISKNLKILKEHYEAKGELKWNKVSQSKSEFYIKLVDFFFDNPELKFRCIVVDDKTKLNHAQFNKGSHDAFYYKMYFYMIKNILNPKFQYNIYLDIKDTRGGPRVEQLTNVLRKYFTDYDGNMIPKVQQIRSHESELLQLADFLIGAISYVNRDLYDNKVKKRVVDRIEENIRHNLKKTTPPWEEKFNIFIFSPQSMVGE